MDHRTDLALHGGLFFIGALIDLILVPGMVRVENLTQRILAQAAPFPDR
jgi:hypothetical protein